MKKSALVVPVACLMVGCCNISGTQKPEELSTTLENQPFFCADAEAQTYKCLADASSLIEPGRIAKLTSLENGMMLLDPIGHINSCVDDEGVKSKIVIEDDDSIKGDFSGTRNIGGKVSADLKIAKASVEARRDYQVTYTGNQIARVLDQISLEPLQRAVVDPTIPSAEFCKTFFSDSPEGLVLIYNAWGVQNGSLMSDRDFVLTGEAAAKKVNVGTDGPAGIVNETKNTIAFTGPVFFGARILRYKGNDPEYLASGADPKTDPPYEDITGL